MKNNLSREEAIALLKKYNKDEFHLRHALMVEAVMGEFAKNYGYEEDLDFWKQAGLLHDIDFELYPDQHCQRAPELLRDGGASEEMIHAVCSHGYGICSDVEPEHQMEKILFACDELTGLIYACQLVRPSKSSKDMKLKSLKKKFKSLNFAAGCDREIILTGAERLGWDTDRLLRETLEAVKETEDQVEQDLERIKD